MAVEVRGGVVRLLCPQCAGLLCVEEAVVSCVCGWRGSVAAELAVVREVEASAGQLLEALRA